MKCTGIAVLAFCGLAAGYGQQQAVPHTADTSTTPHIIIVDPGLSTGRPTLLLPAGLQYAEETPGDMSMFALWKKTSVRPPLLGVPLEPKADLTASLRLQWAKDNELKTLRTVLGTVQLGGAAYLAYRALTSSDTPKPVKKK
jgi:hypothetical protein